MKITHDAFGGSSEHRKMEHTGHILIIREPDIKLVVSRGNGKTLATLEEIDRRLKHENR